MLKQFAIIIFISVQFINSYAQQNNLIQLTGVVNNDSLEPLPFVHIVLVTKNQGTISNFYGFFSFVAEISDTIIFSSIGYKHKMFVLPDSIDSDDYFVNVKMERDTIMLMEIKVFPWPTFEQFKLAFLSLKIPDDDYERALKNMEIINIQKFNDFAYSDAGLSYKTYMNQQYNQIITRGQYPINNLLNPYAWAKFINAIKDGDFRRKEE